LTWKTPDAVIEIDAADPDDRHTVRIWVDGHLAADVNSITVTTFDVKVTMTNGVGVEVPRLDPRLMATVERAVSLGRRQAPPPRLRPLRASEFDLAEFTDLEPE
jgi:hypothetical protein